MIISKHNTYEYDLGRLRIKLLYIHEFSIQYTYSLEAKRNRTEQNFILKEHRKLYREHKGIYKYK